MKQYLITLCLLCLCSVAFGQTADKRVQQTSRLTTHAPTQFSLSGSDWLLSDSMYADDYAYDLLKPQSRARHAYLNTQNSVYGHQVMFRMQFADWLSLRLGVYDDSQVNQLFMPVPNQIKPSDSNDFGYQLGISSVLDISTNWRFGVDLSTGQVSGDVLGLYQDQLDTTSFGLGVRNQRFGASLHSDFASSQQNSDLYRSSIDLQVDWHFNQDGTLSFGARKNMNDNASTNLDQFTGTVPYIKFKHNL
ncbi:hypothetical protein [Marinicella gelatinilytica]|uniref:hypothetical protein n=1 Tax=Marinicella gelatinilytica TaxID=2996017 RepID=UPI002260AAF1|nr:hypothetical protein [Marinicella gelatinilytica]MCX7544460.1 hypothetical protein [Marinicella gelatinilytica]